MAASYGLRRAINELKSIFACQWRNGMLPQIRFVPGGIGYRPDADDWGVSEETSGPTRYRTSGITQPPIVGLCAYRVYQRTPEEERARYLPEFLAICEGLGRYHDWLLRERDPNDEKLVVCVHPWETGTDNSPPFLPLIGVTHEYIGQSSLSVETYGRADTRQVDPTQRPTERDYYAYFGLMALFKSHGYRQEAVIAESPFLLQDVLFNTLLATSLSATAQLQESIARDGDWADARVQHLARRVEMSQERAKAVTRAIRSKLWHEGHGLFYGFDLRNGRLLTTPSVSSLIPLLGGVATDAQAARLVSHLDDQESFGTPVPVPSTPANSPFFDGRRYWSGPSWPVTNWLLFEGLRAHDPAKAERLRVATLDMIAEGESGARARELAAQVMERNSYGEEFTTPSGMQYAHGWLWDSAIVAMSWPLVMEKPDLATEIPAVPGFWEYYDPSTGEPLGAPSMTWTASLLLELSEADI